MYSVPYVQMSTVRFDTSQIIGCKDSPTARAQELRNSLEALHKELEFAGQPDAHLLSFWRAAGQWFFLLHSSCFSYDLIFTFICLPLDLYSLHLCLVLCKISLSAVTDMPFSNSFMHKLLRGASVAMVKAESVLLQSPLSVRLLYSCCICWHR